MTGSPGAAYYSIKRHRERYAKMTPEQRVEDDAYWAKQAQSDRVVFSTLVVAVAAVLAWVLMKW